MRYLSLDTVLRLHKNLKREFDIIEGEIKKGKIQIILDKLKETPYSEEEKYNTIYKKAACILEGIVRGHIFPDANKRTALHATYAFLQSNNHHLVIPLNTVEFLVRIARNKAETEEEIDDLIYEIADWIKDRSATTSMGFTDKSRKYLINPINRLRLVAFTGIGLIYVYYVINKWLATKHHPEYEQKFDSIFKFLSNFSTNSVKALDNLKDYDKK